MKRKRILTITAIAATVSGIIFGASSFRHKTAEEESTPVKTEIRLNDTLSNDMSDIDTLYSMDRKIEAYLEQWGIRGASLAIMRNDSLVYAKGYGWADEGKGEKMDPRNIMRMASVSKLITATGIMVLQERGLLSLGDTVFGASGILNDSTYTASIRDKSMYGITVEQLLRHKGGFSNRRGIPCSLQET